MKNFFTIAALGCTMLFGSNESNAQTCWLESDSIISGEETTRITKYYYDVSERINVVHDIDSNSTVVSRIDSVFYDVNGNYSSMKSFYESGGGFYTQDLETTYTFNGLNQMSRIYVSGNDGSPWTMAHDIYYNASGDMTSLELDPTSLSGSPDGFNGSFKNITWLNGNLSSLDMIGDLGLGIDTIELVTTVDTKRNVARLKLVRESGDLLSYFNVNNWETVATANDEVFGSAGLLALGATYVYDANDEVFQQAELPSLFEPGVRTHEYKYNCTAVGLDENLKVEFSVYPNPSKGSLNFNSEEVITRITLSDVNGKLIGDFAPNSKRTQLDLNVEQGMYLVNVTTKSGLSQQKLIIE